MAGLNAVVLGVTGLALLPILGEFIIPPIPRDEVTNVRVILGLSKNKTDDLGFPGNVPGVALWDVKGKSIGTRFGKSEKIPEGNFHDIEVVSNPGVGNAPADYISITNGGDDAICIAGLTVTFPNGDQAAWSADVAFQCNNTGAFVFPTQNQITDIDAAAGIKQNPHCVWIDRDASGGIPHQGFGIHLSDFGNKVTSAQVDAYNADPNLMCQSGPRFRMYGQLRSENPILTFDPPLEYDAEGKDLDPRKVINNPGVFGDQDKIALRLACIDNNKLSGCAQLPTQTIVPIIDKRTITPTGSHQRTHPRDNLLARRRANHDSDAATETTITATSQSQRIAPPQTSTTTSIINSKSSTSSTATSTEHQTPKDTRRSSRFQGQLIVSSKEYHSAKKTCEHPNSFGPSFASTHEGFFCDMTTKKLYPICNADTALQTKDDKSNAKGENCCFSVEKKTYQSCPGQESFMRPQTFTLNTHSAPGGEGDELFSDVQYW